MNHNLPSASHTQLVSRTAESKQRRSGDRWSSQAGLSLPQVLIAGAIGMSLVVAGLAVAPKAMSMFRSSSESNNLPPIIQNIQGVYAQYPNYANITIDTLVRSNVFPQNETTIPAVGTAATATNQWGGNYTASVGTLTTTNDIARLIDPNVPNAECISIVQAVAGGLRQVWVDSTNSGNAGAGTLVKADQANLNSTTLANACGSNNSITFDIAK